MKYQFRYAVSLLLCKCAIVTMLCFLISCSKLHSANVIHVGNTAL